MKPLIFDSVVEDSLKFLHRAFDVRWDAELSVRQRKVARYLRYCAMAQTWANDLDLPGGVVGAEKIEQFLFRPSSFVFDTASEMRKLAEAVARDRRAGLAGPETAAVEINPDLLASFDEP